MTAQQAAGRVDRVIGRAAGNGGGTYVGVPSMVTPVILVPGGRLRIWSRIWPATLTARP